MKKTNGDDRLWVECAVLTGLSAFLTIGLNLLFSRYKPLPLGQKKPPVSVLPPLWDSPTPDEKAQAEPVRQTLNQATAEVDTPEKAQRVAERLEELVGNATAPDVEQAAQPAKSASTSDNVADSSRRIERAAQKGSAEEKAAQGIAQAVKEITSADPGREKEILSNATQETLNPEPLGSSPAGHSKQREYLRQAVLKRMTPFNALDASIFMAINHLPHNRWLNGFFRFFTLIFTGGVGWYLMMIVSVLINPRKGAQLVRSAVLPLSAATSLVEFPIKAFFHRRRPFITYIQATVIGKKPGSWSLPSGHSASAFAGAWLLSSKFPARRPIFFLLAALVGFSRIYLGDHYPGDVASGAISGMILAESIQRAQRGVEKLRGVSVR